MDEQIYINQINQMVEHNIGVLNAVTNQWLREFVLIKSQKRIRIDVHDSLSNYRVVDISSDNDVVAGTVYLNDWELNYT